MLGFYTRLAQRLHRLRGLVWLLALAGVGSFAATLVLVEGRSSEGYMVLQVCLVLWTLCLLVVMHGFRRPAPEITPEHGFFARMRIRLARGARWIIALAMTGLCVAVVVVTLRAVGIAVRSLSA